NARTASSSHSDARPGKEREQDMTTEMIERVAIDTMRATVFHGPGDIRVEEVPRPHAGPGEAVVKVTLTTICGTDIHIVKGEYPVKPGLVIGHEPVGVIAEL